MKITRKKATMTVTTTTMMMTTATTTKCSQQKLKQTDNAGKNIEIFPTPINKLWYFFMGAVVVSASLIHTNSHKAKLFLCLSSLSLCSSRMSPFRRFVRSPNGFLQLFLSYWNVCVCMRLHFFSTMILSYCNNLRLLLLFPLGGDSLCAAFGLNTLSVDIGCVYRIPDETNGAVFFSRFTLSECDVCAGGDVVVRQHLFKNVL